MRHFTRWAGFMICASIMIVTCDKSTEPKGNSIFGKWYLYKTETVEYIEGRKYLSETEPYDPGTDQYYHAQIIEITKDRIIGYENGSGSRYNSWPTDITLVDSMIIITNEYYDFYEEDYVTVQDTGTYSFDGSMLVFRATYHEDDDYAVVRSYLKKYKGRFPPKSWTTALAGDQYEPDNTIDQATTIAVGGNSQEHTLTGNDQDWFIFTADAGKTYLITVSGYMDNVLALYGPDRTRIAEDDDNDWDIQVPGNVESVLVWNCESAGNYYFSVTAFFSQDEGYYTAAVALTELESPLDQIEKAERKKDRYKEERQFPNYFLSK
jgi:hypothetical protein